MTWISLVCLLALTGSAFSRSIAFPTAIGTGYGGAAFPLAPKIITPVREVLQRPVLPVVSTGYGAQTEVITPVLQTETVLPKVLNNYDTTVVATAPVTKVLPVGGYGGSRLLFDQTPAVLPTTTVVGTTPGLIGTTQTLVAPTTVLTQAVVSGADLACRGQLPETVIPLDGGQRFYVCLDDGKGTEQFCPKGLVYVEALRRCERRTGPFDSCASQPCLNGGLCLNTDYTYQCNCQAGFDGKNCELDARICQTQQPCGLGSDARCQSFRWGAALEYICVFQDGDIYGLNPGQVYQTPCAGIDGPHALAYTNKGFIMCDGERTFFESCPGGTIWDDFNKACVWPDMHPYEIATPVIAQRTLVAKTGYGGAVAIEQPKVFLPKVIEPVRQVVSSYGGDVVLPTKVVEPLRPVVSSYGGDVVLPTKVVEPLRPVVSSYGGEIIAPKVFEPVRQVVSSYGGIATAPKVLVEPTPRLHFEQPRVITSYGGPREELVVKQPY